MSLTEYRRKRDFEQTPEPSGGAGGLSAGQQFVVQKHAASRLHYDFRLELDGVLKSWAVPKGPSLDPEVKSLAVHVEDHPLEYGAFEGVIPQQEYGGGTVMVWDRGTWKPVGDALQAYKKGRLKFRLEGEKLHGEWSLVRMGGKSGEDGKNWLLIKKKDDAARPAKKYDVLAKEPRSVLSGRDLEEIAGDADRVWSSNGKAAKQGKRASPKKTGGHKRKSTQSRNPGKVTDKIDPAGVQGARRRSMPAELKPQLATLVSELPEGDQWLHEIKFDGYRILAFLREGGVRLVTRNGNDWTDRFSHVAEEIAQLPVTEGILDGEVVALVSDGSTSFQRLQNWLKRGKTDELVLYAFDLPYLNGHDLTRAPLVDRKQLLARVLLTVYPENDGTIRYSDHIQGQGQDVLEHACRAGLEGIISKRADSTYEQGRSRRWLKIKCLGRQEFVIGGFTKPSGSRTGFGALLLGYYRDGKLHYCGRVGTGFTQDSLRQLSSELKRLATGEPPFVNPPTGSERKGVTWIAPKLVGEVEFTQWTDDDRLRHPSFQGLRDDKPPKQVVRERAPAAMNNDTKSSKTKSVKKNHKPKAAARGATGRAFKDDEPDRIAGIRLSNPDRVLYPQQELTKRDLALFYKSIADWILPYIVDRPLTLVRCPKGREGQCFYQKHLTESMPDTLRGVMIEEKKKEREYVVVDDLAGLISLVQMGVLEMHPWPARSGDLEHPDQLVFDLDPGEGTTWNDVVQGARDVRHVLQERGLESFLRTSGGKGLHLVVPLARQNSWDELKAFAKSVAEDLAKEQPDRYVANMSKAKRRGKIFLDYLRNQRGATAIASYSTRAREGAPVATPVRWDELSTQLAPDKYTVENLPRRLSALKNDPWADFFKVKQSIQAVRS